MRYVKKWCTVTEFLVLIYMYDNSEPGGILLSQKYLGSGHWIQNANDS